MRNARLKPPRAVPSLLTIPNRDRVVEILQRACTEPHTLIAVELEHRPTLRFGEVSVLTVFAKELGIDRIEHIMQGDVTQQQLEGAAEILGQCLGSEIRRRERIHGRRKGTAGSFQ